MIVSQNLAVNYKWRQEPVLKGVTGSFEGKLLILGPNGSGKTTFFKSICGLTNITSGEILIDGQNMKDLYATCGLVSTNFQDIFTLVASNVYDIIKLYTDLSNGNADLAFEIITTMGIGLDLLKKQKLTELSAGQTKIVCSALALAMKAKYVLLDEPFEELDPAKKGKLIKYLDDYHGNILANTHETWLLKRLQDWNVFFMFEGLIYGPVAVKDLLNANISFVEDPDALLTIKVANKTISILKGGTKGTLLSSLENLDRIYDLTEEA